MNNKQIVRRLNYCYYGCMVTAVLVAGIMHLLIDKGLLTPMPAHIGAGVPLQTVAIATTLFLIPFGLYMFKKQCSRIRLIADEAERERTYVKTATMRILTIGTPLVTDIAFYYLLGGYPSLIWLAAIAAIALYFCKPNERKIDLELQSDEDSY